mmetsp:Transcript_5524/g.13351  ORF Transcript_5524/g.13351 Transcript_5524/m.13351 type:complete len:202 (-) Transcript_5524:62-667(-)
MLKRFCEFFRNELQTALNIELQSSPIVLKGTSETGLIPLASYDVITKTLKVKQHRDDDDDGTFALTMCHELIHHVDTTSPGIVGELFEKTKEAADPACSPLYHLARALSEANAHLVQGLFDTGSLGTAARYGQLSIALAGAPDRISKTKEFVKTYSEAFRDAYKQRDTVQRQLELFDQHFTQDVAEAFFQQQTRYRNALGK